MKQAVMTAPGHIEVHDVPVPTPGADEVEPTITAAVATLQKGARWWWLACSATSLALATKTLAATKSTAHFST